MSLREQFEAWINDAYKDGKLLTTYKQRLMFEAYQAGHAASGRDELIGLLESLRDYCVRTYNTQTKAIANGEESLDWNKGYRSGVSAVLEMIKLAIEEARGE